MRVLHVVATGERRGAEMFASELVAALAKKDVDQRVVVLRGSNGVAVPFDAPVVALGSSGRRLPGLRVDLRSSSALRKLTANWAPHVIQAHGGEALKHCVLFKARGSSYVVYRRIGSAPPWVAGRTRRSVHGRLMARADRVVTLADGLRQQTIDLYGVPADRVVTIPRGVDPRRIVADKGRAEFRLSLDIPTDAGVILSLGALTREKDPIRHLEVAQRVMSEKPEVVHVIAGDGPMRDEVARAAVSMGIADHVRLLGNRGDVGNLLAASDVMILASATEGMPGCLIEAGMAGLATAAYSVAAVPEVVQDGRTGLLSAPGDIAALTRNVARLLDDEAMRMALGRNARAWCLSNFDTRAISQRYLELYSEIISSRSQGEKWPSTSTTQ
jgi:glycosyltransferase involved in cell wall biosynthesis